MTQITFETIYRDRCKQIENKIIPHYWNPQPIIPTKFCLFGDERSDIKAEWDCEATISRIVAAGIELELEVGNFVEAATHKDIPLEDYKFLKELLKSNVADEAHHYKGFVLAREAYNDLINPIDVQEAAKIRKHWQFLAEKHHPLLIALAMEVGVFLPTLGISRLIGGSSLASMAAKIAEDEFRHVIVNRSVLEEINIECWNLPGEIRRAIADSLKWIVGDLDIPESSVGEQFNFNFILDASNKLVSEGEAEDFNDLLYVADHVLPFEVDNSVQYDRAVFIEK